MNELIERYVYDVTRRLPEKERGEVKRELEANISDMLPENPAGHDITSVITELGAPSELAEQYRQNPRYLISPALFELYISVLKAVMLIAATAAAGINIVAVLYSYDFTITEIFTKGIVPAIEVALHAALWVTLGFYLAERSGKTQKPWSIEKLPKLPDNKGVTISRASSVTGLVLSVLFTAFLFPVIISNHFFHEFRHGAENINLFPQETLIKAIPYVVLFCCMAFILNGLKMYYGKWNIPLCAANILYNVIWVSIVVYILRWDDYLNRTHAGFVVDRHGSELNISRYYANEVFTSIVIIFVIIAVIDIGAGVWKTMKGIRKT